MPRSTSTAKHERGHGSFAQHLHHGAQNLQQGLSVPLSLLPQQLTALPRQLLPDFLEEGAHLLTGRPLSFTPICCALGSVPRTCSRA